MRLRVNVAAPRDHFSRITDHRKFCSGENSYGLGSGLRTRPWCRAGPWNRRCARGAAPGLQIALCAGEECAALGLTRLARGWRGASRTNLATTELRGRCWCRSRRSRSRSCGCGSCCSSRRCCCCCCCCRCCSSCGCRRCRWRGGRRPLRDRVDGGQGINSPVPERVVRNSGVRYPGAGLSWAYRHSRVGCVLQDRLRSGDVAHQLWARRPEECDYAHHVRPGH